MRARSNLGLGVPLAFYDEGETPFEFGGSGRAIRYKSGHALANALRAFRFLSLTRDMEIYFILPEYLLSRIFSASEPPSSATKNSLVSLFSIVVDRIDVLLVSVELRI